MVGIPGAKGYFLDDFCIALCTEKGYYQKNIGYYLMPAHVIKWTGGKWIEYDGYPGCVFGIFIPYKEKVHFSIEISEWTQKQVQDQGIHHVLFCRY